MSEWMTNLTALITAATGFIFVVWLVMIRKGAGNTLHGFGEFLKGAGALMRRLSKAESSTTLNALTSAINSKTQMIDATPVKPKRQAKPREHTKSKELSAPSKS